MAHHFVALIFAFMSVKAMRLLQSEFTRLITHCLPHSMVPHGAVLWFQALRAAAQSESKLESLVT